MFGTGARGVYARALDRWTPWTRVRWVVLAAAALAYVARVTWLGGFHVVSYALAIYYLNLLVAFVTPAYDPENNVAADDSVADQGASALPSRAADEFRPFVRKLPEFKFWLAAARAALLALVATFLPFLDLPVFWPILVIYFLVLLGLTLRRQIALMLRHRYVPYTTGKPRPKKLPA
jgi:hypothetical protein